MIEGTRSVIPTKEIVMLGWIVLILLIMLLVGALPVYPYSRTWGYGPSGLLTVLLVVLLLMLVFRVF